MSLTQNMPSRLTMRLLAALSLLLPNVLAAQEVTPEPVKADNWTTFQVVFVTAIATSAAGGVVWLLKRVVRTVHRSDLSKKLMQAIRRKTTTDAKELPNVVQLHERLRNRLATFIAAHGRLPERPQNEQRKRIIAVVSGKGGVGKSTLSLGLAEYFSTYTGVCLIDLDMPNRGLTSLLDDGSDQGKALAQGTTLFEEFSQFCQAITPKEKEVRDRLQVPPDEALHLISFGDAQQAIKARDVIHGGDMNINAVNVRVMRSIQPPSLYLASDVFTASEVAVREFLYSLERRQIPGIGTMVIDCHGAHDLLMVGAIQAATDIVVTMTAETGSFDGTFELLAYALSNAVETRTVSITLVINNVAPWQKGAAAELKKFFQLKFAEAGAVNGRVKVDTWIVPQSDEVRRVMGHYTFGAVSKTPLWEDVSRIGYKIRQQPMAGIHEDVENEVQGQTAPPAEMPVPPGG